MGQRSYTLWIVAVLILLIGTGAQAATYTQAEEIQFEAADVEELEIQGANGSITFKPWAGSQIHVTATKQVTTWSNSRAQRVAQRIRIDTETQNGQVQVKASLAPGQLFVQQAVSFEVLVPEGWYGTIRLATSNGSIRAEAIHGNVTLETSNGSIIVEGHAGRLYARTSNGRIELHEVNTNLYARTSNGRVVVTEAILRGSGEIRTSNGAVTVDAGLHEDSDYVVRTSNGSMTLTLAHPVDVALDLSTSNGSVRLAEGVEVHVTEFGRTSMRGRIGDGRAKLEGRTSNGSITLAVD